MQSHCVCCFVYVPEISNTHTNNIRANICGNNNCKYIHCTNNKHAYNNHTNNICANNNCAYDHRTNNNCTSDNRTNNMHTYNNCTQNNHANNHASNCHTNHSCTNNKCGNNQMGFLSFNIVSIMALLFVYFYTSMYHINLATSFRFLRLVVVDIFLFFWRRMSLCVLLCFLA